VTDLSLPSVHRRGRRKGLWKRSSLKARLGALIVGVFAVLAVIGPTIAPYNPSFANPSPSAALHAPDAAHLLGTTNLGQDVLSQLLVGIRMTMEIGLIVGIIAISLATIVGVSAGFLGGVWDEVLSLFTNVLLVLPVLPLLVVLLGYAQARGQVATIAVLSALSWPWSARIIRAQTLSLRSRDFVAASREVGERTWRIVLFEIMPNEVSLIAANFLGIVLYAIGTSVALAFLGLANLSSWSLGTMLYWAEGQSALPLGAWWWFVPPGVAVALIGTGLVLLNFSLDELGNPRLRSMTRGTRLGRRVLHPTDPTPVLRPTLTSDKVRLGTLSTVPRRYSRSNFGTEGF
jgi:peptide/nickel transport system permease protein